MSLSTRVSRAININTEDFLNQVSNVLCETPHIFYCITVIIVIEIRLLKNSIVAQ